MKSLVTELQFEQLENQELKIRLSALKSEIKLLKMRVDVLFKEVALSQSNTNTLGFIKGEVILDQEAQAKVLSMIEDVIKTN